MVQGGGRWCPVVRPAKTARRGEFVPDAGNDDLPDIRVVEVPQQFAHSHVAAAGVQPGHQRGGTSQTCLNERNLAADSASATGFSSHSNARVVLRTMGGVQPSRTSIVFSTAFRDPRRRLSSSLLSAAANAGPHSPRARDVLHQRPAPPRLPATPGRPSDRLRAAFIYFSRERPPAPPV